MEWEMFALPRSFYLRDTVTVARALLGAYVVRRWEGEYLMGKIVETEAYVPFGDEAAHGFRGRTTRNASMFKVGGHAYVHQQRHHYLLDIVAEREGVPGGVLIRALEPVTGVATMVRLRGVTDLKQLTSGPGKVCQALGITKAEDGIDLADSGSDLIVSVLPGNKPKEITTTLRVGISKAKEQPLRFYITGNPYVSK